MVFRVALSQKAFNGHLALYFRAVDLAEALQVALSAEEDSVIVLLVGAVVEFSHRHCKLGNAGVLLCIVAATRRVAVDVVVEIPVRTVGLVPVACGGGATVCCALG